jgi:hypothetical protein
MEKESFIYTISSSDRLNNGANQVYYDIDFGGFSSHHENYKIQVVNFMLSGSLSEVKSGPIGSPCRAPYRAPYRAI